MALETVLILFCAGILAGVLSGTFGVGGGIVIVPSLFAVYAFTGFQSPYTVHTAVATSLFIIIFTSISSSYKQFKKNNIEWTASLIIGVASAAAVYLFSKIAISMPGDNLKIIFSAVLIIVSVKMLLDKKRHEDEDNSAPLNYSKLLCVLIGVLTGAIAAFTGLGGGVFVVPLMHYLLKFPFRKSIGTSSAAILLTSAAGVLSYFLNTPADMPPMPYSLGMVDVLSAVPVIAASIPFAQLGVYIHHKVHTFWLTKLFALLILAVAVRMLFF